MAKRKKLEPLTPAEAELHWLRWFITHADFGPADSEVRDQMCERYTEETGLEVPEGYRSEEESA